MSGKPGNRPLATDYLVSTDPSKPRFHSGHFEFADNAVVPATPGMPSPGDIPAEHGGHRFPTLASIGLSTEFRLEKHSPLRGAARPHEKSDPALPDIGALQPGDSWYPLQVGPMADNSSGQEGEILR